MAGAEPGEEPAPHDLLFQDRARASSFGANAELYDRSRPRYPEALIDDLATPPPAAVIDVGCGTGLLGRSFVERGIPVLGVEPDAQMAAVARRHGLEVEVAPFEAWDPGGRRFELLVSGQAWHWVTPDEGAAKAAEVLVPGAIAAHAWNVGVLDDDLAARLADVYGALAGGSAHPLVPHSRATFDGPPPSELAFAATGEFDEAEHRTYAWEHRYTRDEWLDQLQTHSDHALMEPAARDRLLAGVGDAIDEHGGGFVMHYTCEVTLHRRR